MKLSINALLTLAVMSFGLVAQADEACKFPDKKGKLSSAARAACLQKVSLSKEFTLLTPQDLREGPSDFKIKSQTAMNCEFLPRGAYGGKSLKFFCIATDDQGTYYNTKQELVPDAKSFNPQEELLGADGTVLLDANGKKQKGLRLKVKYVSDAGTFVVEERFREAFTEVASTRILMALGLYADAVVQVEKLTCKGCNQNPYATDQRTPVAGSKTFLNVAVESRLEGKAVETSEDEGWTLAELELGYNTWTIQKQIDYQMLLAAANILNHHNTTQGKQNTIKCPKAGQNSETFECATPVALFDDVGSTFGGSGGFGNNPRGDYKKYSGHRAISGCNFKIGEQVKTLTKAGQQEFLKRAANLSPAHVEAIVEAARFDIMDSDQIARLGGDGKAAAREWAEKINSLVKEITSANCR